MYEPVSKEIWEPRFSAGREGAEGARNSAATSSRQVWARDLREIKAWWRRSTPESIVNGVYGAVGGLIGGLGAIATFLVVLIAAVDSGGWLIGLSLGWILGLLAGAAVFWAGRYLWPLPLLLALYVASHLH